MELELLSHFLPEGLLDYFEAVKLETGEIITIHLDEKNTPPERGSYTSKGFREAITLQDFPIRKKACYLRIRRRK